MAGWLIFLLVLCVFLWMPCGLYANYHSNRFAVALIIGPFRMNLLRPKKVKKKREKKNEKPFESTEQIKEQRKIGDFFPLLQLIFDLLSDFRKKVSIQELQFKLALGGSDPFALSINYGRYWAVLGNIFPHIDSWFNIKKRNLEITCDYTASSTKIDAAIDLRLPLIVLLQMVLHHGLRIIIKYYKISKEPKEGAVS